MKTRYETIYINNKTTNLYIARQLFLKKKITQREMLEFSQNLTREDLIQKAYQLGFFVKEKTEEKTKYEPKESKLYEDNELL